MLSGWQGDASQQGQDWVTCGDHTQGQWDASETRRRAKASETDRAPGQGTGRSSVATGAAGAWPGLGRSDDPDGDDGEGATGGGGEWRVNSWSPHGWLCSPCR